MTADLATADVAKASGFIVSKTSVRVSSVSCAIVVMYGANYCTITKHRLNTNYRRNLCPYAFPVEAILFPPRQADLLSDN